MVSYFVEGNDYVADRIVGMACLFAYLCVALYFQKQNNITTVSAMLLAMYSALILYVMWNWGINVPTATMSLLFIVLLAGVTLGTRAIIAASLCIISVLVILQALTMAGIAQPDLGTSTAKSGFGDVATYSVFIAIFGLVAWLSSRKTEQALQIAIAAEANIENEKQLLSKELKKRTIDLQQLQKEETKQLYRFAELGQLSTLLLHELANNLTVLTLDIESLEQRDRRSQAIQRAKQSIAHLDVMVDQVREQIKHNDKPVESHINSVVDDAISYAKQKANDENIIIIKQNHCKNTALFASPIRLLQILTVLITNAVEAYEKTAKTQKIITITIDCDQDNFIVSINDTGKGMTTAEQKHLFEPFHSTKKDGMGIGLFAAKQMVETHFHGTITASSRKKTGSTFTVTLPRQSQ